MHIACSAVIAYNAFMATLTIRDVDATVKERLRIRAARHGRSMEAELRSILSEVLVRDEDRPQPNLAEAIRRRFAPLGGVELEPHPPVPIGDPPSFDR
jgi:plasmid stability protein